jgi:EpsI family protein
MTNRSFVASLVIFSVTIAVVTLLARRSNPVVVKTNLENLPMEIDGYYGMEDSFPESVYKELNADKHVYRHYKNVDGKQIDLYVGYYGTAKGGRTGHNPYACLPGAGWGIVDSRMVKVRAKYYGSGVDINYILARKGDIYESVLHWYQSAENKVLATGIKQNIQRFIGKVFYNRNDGAFVRISVFSKEEGVEEANLLVRSFAEKILDLLPRYWPIEK